MRTCALLWLLAGHEEEAVATALGVRDWDGDMDAVHTSTDDKTDTTRFDIGLACVENGKFICNLICRQKCILNGSLQSHQSRNAMDSNTVEIKNVAMKSSIYKLRGRFWLMVVCRLISLHKHNFSGCKVENATEECAVAVKRLLVESEGYLRLEVCW